MVSPAANAAPVSEFISQAIVPRYRSLGRGLLHNAELAIRQGWLEVARAALVAWKMIDEGCDPRQHPLMIRLAAESLVRKKCLR